MGKRSSPKYIDASQDIRVAATTKIWGLTVGMLALCIPLSAVTRSGAIIPLAALGGATAGTFAIWRADERKSKPHYFSNQEVERLEQRIANLETIVSSGDSDLHAKIQRLDADNPSGVMTQVTTPENKA
ncbi:hypothetical protein [Nostoc parmelioides]|uniref:Uncharacterized protein n=1 Tax=Nostoc parmelioides FACHB-3921 TaxID=2692909 RepID=A0ABR8BCN1_9NOSO|nr:hypothetical protein [Nostoc parmelioides]MBD2250747.1 hypothetical protein [Nostoc parmelioides FACHB-3921]